MKDPRASDAKKEITKSKVLDYDDTKQIKKAFHEAVQNIQVKKMKEVKPKVIKAEWTMSSP